MANPVKDAQELLNEFEETIRATTVNDVWWKLVRGFVASVKVDTVLGPLVGSLEEPSVRLTRALSNVDGKVPEINTFLAINTAPVDFMDWGRKAWLTLVWLDETADQPGAFKEHTTSPIYKARDAGNDRMISIANEGWVYPTIRWLRREIGLGASVNGLIERWGRRTEWLGLDGADDKKDVDEALVQKSLQRYLFDNGLDFFDQAREQHSAKGRVDFALRGTEPVAVELKVWRGDESMNELKSWFKQAKTYPVDFGIQRAYLAILVTSKGKALEFSDEWSSPAHVRVGEITIHLRIIDNERWAPSKSRGRKVVSLRKAHLEP